MLKLIGLRSCPAALPTFLRSKIDAVSSRPLAHCAAATPGKSNGVSKHASGLRVGRTILGAQSIVKLPLMVGL